jgi:3-methylcrotonyl-CoA carboxylase beta subunit
LYPAEDILGIVGTNLRKPYDMKQVIARIVDESKFHEFKEHYGKQLVTGSFILNQVSHELMVFQWEL